MTRCRFPRYPPGESDIHIRERPAANHYRKVSSIRATGAADDRGATAEMAFVCLVHGEFGGGIGDRRAPLNHRSPSHGKSGAGRREFGPGPPVPPALTQPAP